MPLSIYKYLFKDPDCSKIAHSDLQLGTYTNCRILQLIYSTSRYKMYCRSNIFVAGNEGSILISCATSLALGFIKPHVSLDNSPPGSNLISSSADHPRNDKSQFNIHMLWEKSKTMLKTSAKKISDVCAIQEPSSTSSNKEQFYHGCSKKEQPKQDNNCQADKSAHMWPKQPTNHMWSNRPTVSDKMSMKQIVSQEDTKKKNYDKNCQSTKYIKSEYDDFRSNL